MHSSWWGLYGGNVMSVAFDFHASPLRSCENSLNPKGKSSQSFTQSPKDTFPLTQLTNSSQHLTNFYDPEKNSPITLQLIVVSIDILSRLDSIRKVSEKFCDDFLVVHIQMHKFAI
jgi:hypothetical protein